MVTLDSNERTVHLNISKEDITTDTKFFLDKFKHLTPKLTDLIKKKYASVFSKSHINVTHTNRLTLFIGFKQILTGERDYYGIEGSVIAHFFIHFFNWIWVRASEGERNAMEARLLGSLKDEVPLMAFFVEMTTGFIYLQKNNKVEFIDLIPDEQRQCDLRVSNIGFDLYIEVKSVSSESGMPMTYRLITEGSNAIMDYISSQDERWPFFEISITAIGKGEINYEMAMNSAADIVSQLEAGKDYVENKWWRVSVQCLTRQRINRIYAVLKTGRARSKTGYAMLALHTETPPRGFMGIHLPNWDRSKAIEDACSVALSQTPAKGMKIVWAHINGTPPGAFENTEKTLEYTNIKNRLSRFIERQTKKTDRDPPIGIMVSSDPIAYWQTPDREILSLNFPAALITHPTLQEQAIFHSFCFWKSMPNDLKQSTLLTQTR